MTGVPRSQRLLAWDAPAAGYSPAFQCPDGYVTLVKSAAFWNTNTIAVNVQLLISTPGATIVVAAVAQSIAPDATVEWNGWWVLNPGDAVSVGVDGSGLRAWVSGAVLVGPPQFPPAARDLPLQQPDC